MTNLILEPSSFRDPGGQVYLSGDRVYRSITQTALDDYHAVREKPFIKNLIAKGRLVDEIEVEDSVVFSQIPQAKKILTHPMLSPISYPYEWPFDLLKAAALFHLQLNLDGLKEQISVIDASAYNIQFQGVRPIFIDNLSFRPYQAGQYWIGYQQFCQQFLNPLLLMAYTGIPYHQWYRGHVEGIDASLLTKCLPWHKKLSFNTFLQVTLQAKLQQTPPIKAANIAKKRPFPLSSQVNLLQTLYRWIAKLKVVHLAKATWHDYEKNHSYDTSAFAKKVSFIKDYVSELPVKTLLDLGCNSGEYSQVALQSGVSQAIGIDSCHGALHQAVLRAKREQLNFLPLYGDITNPSPSLGWGNQERRCFAKRFHSDGVLALAFIHHLAIGKNIPLAKILDQLLSLAPTGVIEFVPKSDPMVEKLLALREDIFTDYTQENFLKLLTQRAKIMKQQVITESGRLLVSFCSSLA